MSLLDDNFEAFTVLVPTETSDGRGSTTTTWSDGDSIMGAIVYDNSSEMKAAQAMGVTSVYTLTVRKNVTLDYHTVLRRKSDGRIFRLTSKLNDKQTPKGAILNMRQYDAEEWSLA